MRRLLLALLAGLLALGFSVPQIKAAHAYPGACYATDADNTVYPDGYWGPGSGFPFQTVQDNVTGVFHQVGFDLAAYRLSLGNNCYRSYYVSDWVNDRTNAGSLTAHMRVWICGQPRADFQQDTINDWGRAVVAYGQNQVWGAPWPGSDGVFAYVNTPDGHQWLLGFANYTPCGRQADNWISQVEAGYWTPDRAFVYVNVNG